jgi:hypothetical protein
METNASYPPPASGNARGEAVFCLALMLLAELAACIAWQVTGSSAFLVAAMGFAVLAPLWYRSPVSFSALRQPLGTRLTRTRAFTTADKLFTLIGYGLVLAAIGLYLLR